MPLRPPVPPVCPFCPFCSGEPECLHWNLSAGESRRVSGIVEQPPGLDAGEHLFRVGESLESVYAVRSGAFKMYAFESDGSQCVLGFSLPGELLGFDGVYANAMVAAPLRSSTVPCAGCPTRTWPHS